MTQFKDRKTAIRARMAADGVPYAEAARRMDAEAAQDQDQDRGQAPAGKSGREAMLERRSKQRWVQFDAPVFVRVEPDEDGWGTAITKVVLVVEPESMYLTREIGTGDFLVYDADFELADDADDYKLDGIRGAVSVADDRDRWPEERLISTTDEWEIGPDPRQFPDHYLDNAELAALYPDEGYEDDDEGQDDDE